MEATSEQSRTPPTSQFGDLSRFEFETEYRSIKEDPAFAFYRPCLLNSCLYKRAVGYFSSSIYLVVGPSAVEFARRGGKIRLICSPQLSAEDIDCIAVGYGKRSEIIEQRIVADIDRLLADGDTAYATRVLATLLSVDALDIKIALRSDRKGLYHEKIGVFLDGAGNKVSFKGSANETWSGWHSDGNFESIEVFCSWRGGLERSRVEKHELHFDTLWSGMDRDVEVFSFPSVAREYLAKVAHKGGLDAMEVPPAEPADGRLTPVKHQTDAIASWVAQGRKGIFEHATGSGKTLTAILAIREQAEQGLPTIVLVPSKLLLRQWAQELRREIPKAALLLAGGGNDDWKQSNRLKSMVSPDKALGSRIVLATMQTAATTAFLQSIPDATELLLVADEVHQIGSSANSRILGLQAGKRLGLSATPQRFGDVDGTNKILSYFGGVVPPPITLQDAIHSGRLVPYEYYPYAVTLTATEADDWKQISSTIKLEMARLKTSENGQRELSERVKLLLIRRARIAKKAQKKIDLAAAVISREYSEGQHWLVYCEDIDQLGDVRSALVAAGVESIEYHSAMSGDKDATMAWFRTFGGVLVSIKCLDEGVDIPAVSHALILASSQNPRQFIQRRGRVLRRFPGKQFAVIHDAIVMPTSLENEPEQASLLTSEMRRALEFAGHAINKLAGAELRSIAISLGMDGELSDQFGIEDENDDGD